MHIVESKKGTGEKQPKLTETNWNGIICFDSMAWINDKIKTVV